MFLLTSVHHFLIKQGLKLTRFSTSYPAPGANIRHMDTTFRRCPLLWRIQYTREGVSTCLFLASLSLIWVIQDI